MTVPIPSGGVRGLSPAELSALISSAYDSALERPQWQSLLDAICRAFPGVGVAVVGFEGLTSTNVLVQSGFQPDFVEIYRANPVRWNDSVIHMIGKPPGEVYGDSIVPPDDYQAMDLVKNWLNPQGFGPSSMSVLAARDGRFLAFNLAYPLEGGEAMRPPVEEALQCLVPHIIRAMEISRIVSAGQSVADSLRSLIQTIKLPMIISDPQGQFRFANRAAETLMAGRNLVWADGSGRLVTGAPGTTARLLEAITATSAGQSAEGVMLDGNDGGIAACLVPLGEDVGGLSDFERLLYGGGRNVAILLGQRQSGRLDAGLAAQAFGLSASEAQVSALILDGLGPDAIADQRGTSVRTVRNQLQSVYAKTGVASQRELADALGVFCMFGETIGTDRQVSASQ